MWGKIIKVLRADDFFYLRHDCKSSQRYRLRRWLVRPPSGYVDQPAHVTLTSDLTASRYSQSIRKVMQIFPIVWLVISVWTCLFYVNTVRYSRCFLGAVFSDTSNSFRYDFILLFVLSLLCHIHLYTLLSIHFYIFTTVCYILLSKIGKKICTIVLRKSPKQIPERWAVETSDRFRVSV